MKKNFFYIVLPLLVSYQTQAKGFAFEKVKCLVDTGGAQPIFVDVKRTMGSAPDEKFDYNGNKVAVGFFPGSPYESQQVLTMELNGYKSQIINPAQSLYVLEAPNAVKIQCYIEQ